MSIGFLKRGALRRVSFGRDQSGTAAIEFGILAVPFFGFVLFILQIGLFHFSQQSLDHAVRLAARQIMTGGVPSTAKTAAGFRDQLICPKLLWNASCEKVFVNAYKVAKTSSSKDGTGIYQFVNEATKTLAGPNMDASTAAFCLGGAGDYVFLDVAFDFPDFTFGLLGEATDRFRLRSSTFIYNEPTVSGGGTC